jgi:CheY-like chemotaxis protein
VGDPTRLQQILINLIGNAVKFTERGEVTLTITPSESDPSRLCFAVADTGIGIPGEQLETIFDDFTQAESSTTRRFGGTGLGLGICRRLVERMGGELKVRSEAGKGSTFYFDALFVMSSGAKIDRLEEFSVAGRRVLIVDDNPTNRLILSRMCAAWGMLPTESESAGAAVVTLPQAARNEQPFDLVIVDRVMPGADGFELVSEIRRLAPTMPILMLSSNGTPGDETRAHHLHLAGYALKPVAGDELLRIICDAFREMDHGQAASCVADRQTSQARILIADDSEDNRFLWQAYLANTSYEVVFAENGALAVELANVKPFDLILMDVQMPVMDGLCATRLIRRAAHEQGRSQVPVLALTANAREVDVEASLAAGCNAHLTKPILEAKLISAIEEYLQPVHGPILDPAPALAH